MSIRTNTKSLYKLERRACKAAVKWAEFMELRKDKFKWSQPERVLYEAVSRLVA